MPETKNKTLSPAPTALSRLVISLKFLFAAIPGLFLFLVFTGKFFVDISEPGSTFILQIWSSLAVVAGIIMMLYGTGLWGQWRYIFVFISIPLSFLLYGFLYSVSNFELFDVSTDIFLFLCVTVLLTYYAVRKSVKKQHHERVHVSDNQPQDPKEPME
jgi:hypothetical protein